MTPKKPSVPLERISLALRTDFLRDVRAECDRQCISLSEAARRALRVWLWAMRLTAADSPDRLAIETVATGEYRRVEPMAM